MVEQPRERRRGKALRLDRRGKSIEKKGRAGGKRCRARGLVLEKETRKKNSGRHSNARCNVCKKKNYLGRGKGKPVEGEEDYAFYEKPRKLKRTNEHCSGGR